MTTLKALPFIILLVATAFTFAIAGEVEWNVSAAYPEEVDAERIAAFLSTCELVFKGRISSIDRFMQPVGPNEHGFATVRIDVDRIYIGDPSLAQVDIKLQHINIPGVIGYVGVGHAVPVVGRTYFVFAKRVVPYLPDFWAIPGGFLAKDGDAFYYPEYTTNMLVSDLEYNVQRFASEYSRDETFAEADVVVEGIVREYDVRKDQGIEVDVHRSLRGDGPRGITHVHWDYDSRVVRGPSPSSTQRSQTFLLALRYSGGNWFIVNNSFGVAVRDAESRDRVTSLIGTPVYVQEVK